MSDVLFEMIDGKVARFAKEIADLRNALAIVKAERDHWHALIPRHERVQFPFVIPKSD
jgi:hypothetical protein